MRPTTRCARHAGAHAAREGLRRLDRDQQVSGTTWYLVRVGRFHDRAAAKTMEGKLRSEEGLEAASVTAQ
jgi:hypothetical protein